MTVLLFEERDLLRRRLPRERDLLERAVGLGQRGVERPRFSGRYGPWVLAVPALSDLSRP